jgi:hypothetical protein
MSVHHTQSPARLKEATVTDDTTVRTNPMPYNVRAGKPKAGYAVETVKGQRSRTSPLPGMLKMTDVHGVPVADAPDPLDPTLAGKHEPPVMIHDGMTRQQIAGATFNGEQILREAMGNEGRHGLPLKTSED